MLRVASSVSSICCPWKRGEQILNDLFSDARTACHIVESRNPLTLTLSPQSRGEGTRGIADERPDLFGPEH